MVVSSDQLHAVICLVVSMTCHNAWRFAVLRSDLRFAVMCEVYSLRDAMLLLLFSYIVHLFSSDPMWLV